MYATLLLVTTTQMPDLLGLQSAEFAVPTEARVQKGLTNPGSPGSLQLGAINKITQARLRWALSELTALNLEKVSKWLDEAAIDSPKVAVELLIELIKFTTAQQKSMTVESTTTASDNLGELSLSQLQGLVFQRATDVVAEQ